jgi:hypothetical protein
MPRFYLKGNCWMSFRKISAVLVFFICTHTVYAAVDTIDAETILAKKAQNPVENMISLPFDSNFNFNYGQDNQLQFVEDIKPVIPIELNDKWNIISRIIIPVAVQPNLPSGGYMTGLGDINPTFYLSPANPGKLIWGVGPSFILPSATHYQLGVGKYSVGPSIVLLSMPGNWVLGVLVTNTWSVGGQSSRPSQNFFTLQYFINYNLPKGWYVTTQPLLSADWTASRRNRWTIPVGAGVGRAFRLGKQALNISLQAYDNAKTPRYQSNCQFEINISLLFPH